MDHVYGTDTLFFFKHAKLEQRSRFFLLFDQMRHAHIHCKLERSIENMKKKHNLQERLIT